MAGITIEERIAQLKDTEIYRKLVSGKFSFKTLLTALKRESFNPKTSASNLKHETTLAIELYYSMMFKKGYFDQTRRRKHWLYFRADVLPRLVEKAGQDPDERTLNKFYGVAKSCQLAQKTIEYYEMKRAPVELSQLATVRLLKQKKDSHILYSGGINVVIQNGKVFGFLRQDTVDALCRKGTVTRDVYFNADGRKSYSLWYPGKSNQLPDFLKGSSLPSSYLRACGVGV